MIESLILEHLIPAVYCQDHPVLLPMIHFFPTGSFLIELEFTTLPT